MLRIRQSSIRLSDVLIQLGRGRRFRADTAAVRQILCGAADAGG